MRTDHETLDLAASTMMDAYRQLKFLSENSMTLATSQAVIKEVIGHIEGKIVDLKRHFKLDKSPA